MPHDLQGLRNSRHRTPGFLRKTGAMRKWGLSALPALVSLGIVIALLAQANPAGATQRAERRQIPVARTHSCLGRIGHGSATTIDLQASIENSLIAPVCIDGRGPFHLLIDTGASATAIDSKIAGRLHLASVGPSRQFFGIGRPLSGRPVRIGAWSVGPVPLTPQVVYELNLSLGPHIDGLLGSDVLSRFGAIRLDYDQGQLIVDGPEGPSRRMQVIEGRPGSPLPSVFARYQPQAVLPITVADFDGAAVAIASVTVGSSTMQLEIDSGSNTSAVATSKTAGLGLAPVPGKVRVEGIGGAVKATLERVSSWSLGTVRLVPEDLISVRLPSNSGGPGVDGLLGADVLSQFRAVTIDYSDGTIGVDQIPLV